MVVEDHGLREDPFGVSPDPRFFVLTDTHSQALAAINEGVARGCRCVALLGAAGCGKTTLLLHMVEALTASDLVVVDRFLRDGVRARSMSVAQALGEACQGSGAIAPEAPGESTAQPSPMGPVATRGRRVLIPFDQADQLAPPMADGLLRFLATLPPVGGPITVVLAGPPDLLDRLALVAGRPVDDLIAMTAHLHPLGEAEVPRYIDHHLRVAGYAGSGLFSTEAVRRIAQYSGGRPLAINRLCASALVLAGLDALEVVSAEVIEEAAGDCLLKDLDPPLPQPGAEPAASGAERPAMPLRGLPMVPAPPDAAAGSSAAPAGAEAPSQPRPQPCEPAVAGSARRRPRLAEIVWFSALAATLLFLVTLAVLEDNGLDPGPGATATEEPAESLTAAGPDDGPSDPASGGPTPPEPVAEHAAPAGDPAERAAGLVTAHGGGPGDGMLRLGHEDGDGSPSGLPLQPANIPEPADGDLQPVVAVPKAATPSFDAVPVARPKTPAAAAGTTATGTAKRPSAPDTASVHLAQTLLRRLGYDPGPVDGVAGPQTRTAVARFQSANGLDPDGRLTAPLLGQLQAADDRRRRALAARAPKPEAAPPLFATLFRALGFELDSVSDPERFRTYCRLNPETWVFDFGTNQSVFCGQVAGVVER